ncbi:hypothetical protein H311_01922, partial [Anncaliia algerae PRA109]
MDYNTFGFAFTFFIVSIVLTLAPFMFHKARNVKKLFPSLILFSSGMMLSVALNDITPHLIKPHSKDSHGHHHSHDDHKCHVHEFNNGLFTSGLIFIFLLMIDTLIMNHQHCESDKLEDHKRGEHDHSDHEHPKTECCTDVIRYTTSKLQAFIFVFMISIHSFLEGLGNQSTKTMIALFFHKFIESVSIGITIFTANFSFKFAFLLNFTYSLLTPCGLLIKKLAFTKEIDWFLNGCALGSLFFIIFIEMIPPHFHNKGSSLRKIVLLFTGYVISSLF